MSMLTYLRVETERPHLVNMRIGCVQVMLYDVRERVLKYLYTI